MFLKFLLNFLIAPLKGVVTQLQTNRDANIASIEATVGAGATTAEAAVAGFITAEAKKVPVLAVVVPLAEPALLEAVGKLVQEGNSSIPALYDAGVAFLVHEESVL